MESGGGKDSRETSSGTVIIGDKGPTPRVSVALRLSLTDSSKCINLLVVKVSVIKLKLLNM